MSEDARLLAYYRASRDWWGVVCPHSVEWRRLDGNVRKYAALLIGAM